jgi:hypothetical protein
MLFYRRWAFLSNLITALCVLTLLNTALAAMPFLLIFKAAVAGVIYWFVREYGSRTLYYYTNRGVSPRELWGWSMALDWIIFLVCMAAVEIRLLWTA